MRIVIDEAAKILNVNFPITAEELKTQYRKLSLEYHPDRAGGDEEKFKNLSAAVDFVKKYAAVYNLIVEGEGAESIVKFTIDGTPLSELGLGFGPTINGKPCEYCEGKGHTACVGTTRKDCGGCQGSGYIRTGPAFHNMRRCFACNGAGYDYVAYPNGNRARCYPCTGIGEIRVWNPVIPKGALAMGKVAQRKKAR